MGLSSDWSCDPVTEHGYLKFSPIDGLVCVHLGGLGAFDFWGRNQMGSLHSEPAQQFWPVMPTTLVLIVAKTAKVRSRMGYAMLTGQAEAVGFVACPILERTRGPGMLDTEIKARHNGTN
jgi:hypothetical protein